MEIEYKVKGVVNKGGVRTPRSIVRKTEGDDIFKIEYCNRGQKWKENPELISCWMGSADDGYFSPPDGEDWPLEEINKLLTKWQKGW